MRSRQTNRRFFRLSIGLLGMSGGFTLIFSLLEAYVFIFVTSIVMIQFAFLMGYYYALKHLEDEKRIKYLKWTQYLSFGLQFIMGSVMIANVGLAIIVIIQLLTDDIISQNINQLLLSRIGPSFFIFFFFNIVFAAFNYHCFQQKRKQANEYIFQIQNPSFISGDCRSVSYDSNEVHSKSKIGELCAICLDNYTVNNHQIILPCDHKFHEKCIKEVLTYKRNCPLCRAVA